jgi:hypothetical protein
MNTASEGFIPTRETIEAMRDALLRAHPYNLPAVNFLCDSALLNLRTKQSGADQIAAERQRQIIQEGWTPEHDEEHDAGQLAAAGAAYAMNAADQLHPYSQGDGKNQPPLCWPWSGEWWKPKDPLRDLVRAGALIAAEIDRLKRNALTKPTSGNPAAPWPFPDWKP